MKPFFFFCLLVCAFLGLAFCDMPYGYYQLLRLVVCAFCVYAVFKLGDGQEIKKGLFVIVLLVYQPFVEIPFDRDDWELVNVLTIVLLLGLMIPLGRVSWNTLFRCEQNGKRALRLWVWLLILCSPFIALWCLGVWIMFNPTEPRKSSAEILDERNKQALREWNNEMMKKSEAEDRRWEAKRLEAEQERIRAESRVRLLYDNGVI